MVAEGVPDAARENLADDAELVAVPVAAGDAVGVDPEDGVATADAATPVSVVADTLRLAGACFPQATKNITALSSRAAAGLIPRNGRTQLTL